MARAESTKLRISLPHEQAEWVKSLVNSGRYASVSAVISDCLRLLQTRDVAIEKWLGESVVPACQELQHDPSRGVSVDQVRATLAVRRRQQ
jgi:antitoxin ParD1/3/4